MKHFHLCGYFMDLYLSLIVGQLLINIWFVNIGDLIFHFFIFPFCLNLLDLFEDSLMTKRDKNPILKEIYYFGFL